MSIKLQEELKTVTFKEFSGGLRYDLPFTNLPINAIFDSLNCFFDNGVITKRNGYISVQPNVAGDNSAIRWIDEWYDSNNIQWIIVVTDTSFMTYNVQTNTWVNRTPVGNLHGILSGPVSGWGFAGKYYVTNDVDKPFYWDGVAGNAVFLTVAGAPLRASAVIGFQSHLLWFNVNDPTLGYQPQEIIWSDRNNGLIYNSGDAAVVQLEDTNDVINSVDVMFNILAIARDKSIYNSQFIGFPFFYRFDRRVEKDGIIAANTFKRTNQFIVGFGKNNLIGFDGANESPYLGLQIKSDLLSGIVDTNANKNLRGAWKSIYDVSNLRYRIFMSHRTDGVPDTEYQFSLQSENPLSGTIVPIWSKHQYANLITGIGSYTSQTFPTWNQLLNPWNTYNIRWNDPTVSQVSPVILYGDSVGNLYQWSNIFTDNGIAISAYFKFMLGELGLPNWIKELQRLQFVLTKQTIGILTIRVFESEDGINFNEALNSPYTLDMTKSLIPFVDVMAEGQFFYIQVIDNNINETFEIREIRASFIHLYERLVA